MEPNINTLYILYSPDGTRETFYFDDFTFSVTQQHLAELRLENFNNLN